MIRSLAMKSMIPAVVVIATISGQENHAGSCATTIRNASDKPVAVWVDAGGRGLQADCTDVTGNRIGKREENKVINVWITIILT